MEAQSLGSHQHSWWFSFVFLYEKNWLEAITKKTNGFTFVFIYIHQLTFVLCPIKKQSSNSSPHHQFAG